MDDTRIVRKLMNIGKRYRLNLEDNLKDVRIEHVTQICLYKSRLFMTLDKNVSIIVKSMIDVIRLNNLIMVELTNHGFIIHSLHTINWQIHMINLKE